MDKKSCKNCKHIEAGWLCDINNGSVTKRLVACSKWQRNPDLWLSILPTEEGHYWFRVKDVITGEKWVHDVCEIYVPMDTNEKEMYIRPLHSERSHKLSWLKDAEFQGPITPKGE